MLKLVGVGRKKGRPQDGPVDPPPQPLTPLHASFEWWDNAANGAAKAFRSAVIVNFGLAALAVVLAVVSLLVGDAKWVFVAAEITTTGLLIANTWYVTNGTSLLALLLIERQLLGHTPIARPTD